MRRIVGLIGLIGLVALAPRAQAAEKSSGPPTGGPATRPATAPAYATGPMRVQEVAGLTYLHATSRTTFDKIKETVEAVLPPLERPTPPARFNWPGRCCSSTAAWGRT